MDSLGNIREIIIGSAIAIAAQAFYALIGIFRDLLAGRRERQIKQLEVDAEERKFLAEEELKNKSELKSVYQNAIRNLALIAAHKNRSLVLSDAELSRVVDEASRWLTLLSFHFREFHGLESRSFQNYFEEFRTNPLNYADYVLGQIDRLAMTDAILLPKVEMEEEESITLRSVQIDLDEAFRREQFIIGVELRPNYILKMNVQELSPTQRQLLWDLFPNTEPRPPNRIYLRVPKYDPIKKQIVRNGDPWKARVNLEQSAKVDIFSSWERDYLALLEAAERTQESSKSNGES